MARKRKSKLQKRKDDPNSSYWDDKATTKCREKVMRDFRGRCVVCGKPATQMHHIIGSAVKHLRHDPMNCIPVCFQCHRGNRRRSFHLNVGWGIGWLHTYMPGTFVKVLDRWDDEKPHNFKAAYEELCRGDNDGKVHGNA